MKIQRGRPPQPHVVLPEGDIILMVYLVADLNPTNYPHSAAKAVIHNAKAIREKHKAHADLTLVIQE